MDIGRLVYLVDGLCFDADRKDVVEAKCGYMQRSLTELAKRGRYSELAQFMTLVRDGMVMTRHIFKGIERGLYTDGTPDADKEIITCSWEPLYDAEWPSTRRFEGPTLKQSPRGQVFVVTLAPNVKGKGEFADIEYWIRKWNWVEQDWFLKHAPVDWVTRYATKLWSAER